MKHTRVAAAVACAALACVAVVLSGCHNSKGTLEQSTIETAGTVGGEQLVKGGAQVWAQNCMRCHNLRQPHERSDREWEAIVFHMRVRANLTAEEHRLIVEFLQAAN